MRIKKFECGTNCHKQSKKQPESAVLVRKNSKNQLHFGIVKIIYNRRNRGESPTAICGRAFAISKIRRADRIFIKTD